MNTATSHHPEQSPLSEERYLNLLATTYPTVADAAGEIIQYDFTYVSWFWIAAAVISFLLPILNWRRKQANI